MNICSDDCKAVLHGIRHGHSRHAYSAVFASLNRARRLLALLETALSLDDEDGEAARFDRYDLAAAAESARLEVETATALVSDHWKRCGEQARRQRRREAGHG